MSNFDYQTITTKSTSLNNRRKLDIGDIWSNSLKCLKCNDIIRSRNRHDFVTCSCGTCSIDGGSWYVHINGNFEDYELLTEYYADVKDEDV